MSTVAIHQPNYLPYLGYFYKIANCDKFVFLDNVQYGKNGFVNRNRIKTPNGEAWLTVGVFTKRHFGQLINEAKTNNGVNWRYDHWRSIQLNYARALHFGEYGSDVEKTYLRHWSYLANFNERLIKVICGLLGIRNVQFFRASELKVSGGGTELLVNICKSIGGDAYLSGASGEKYMDEELFKKESIKVLYSEFEHPIYTQLWGGFTPDMSIIDLLFNEGARSLEILGCSRKLGG